MAFRLGDVVGPDRPRSPRRTAKQFEAELVSRRRPHAFRPARISIRRPASSRTRSCCCSTSRAAAALAERDSQRRVPRREASKTSRTRRKPYRAVHDQHAAAGSQPQARLHGPAHDAGRAEPVRKRPHHLHAYRLDQPGAGGDRRRPRPGRATSTATSICRPSPRVYQSKVKNAQEAHEAIRPAGHPFELPERARRTSSTPTSSSCST